MTRFTASTTSQARVDVPRAKVWEALTDPHLLPQLTPNLKSIDVNGHRWRWHLTRIPVLTAAISPSFTEVMTFEEPSFIGYSHDPERTEEKTGVEGSYRLTEAADGQVTDLAIALEITADLPLPALSRRAVEAVMRGVIEYMGRRFSANLLRHLGGHEL